MSDKFTSNVVSYDSSRIVFDPVAGYIASRSWQATR